MTSPENTHIAQTASSTPTDEHVLRIRHRPDADAEAYLYSGQCECGFDCKFWSTERKHVEDVLYEHAMNVADSKDKKAGFAA